MKYLIAGLGNIGMEYADTRHNIGFMVLDALAKASNAAFSSSRYGETCSVRHRGRTYLLLKPSTYMNLSGRAVHYWANREGIPTESILVVLDDIALPLGTLRLRPRGSDGGHNGLKSISLSLGSQEYPRLRFGIGHDFGRGQQADYVLSPWRPEEQELLGERIQRAGEIILSVGAIGVQQTMNLYNNK